MEQTHKLWTIEKHRGARPTSNISVDDPKCELKLRATKIQQVYRIVLQGRMFRFHLEHRIASVCSFPCFDDNLQRSGYQTVECDEV